MAHTIQIQNVATPSVAGRLRTLLAAFPARWSAYWTFVSTLRELSALSDRELADVGINRAEIVQIADEAAKMARRRQR